MLVKYKKILDGNRFIHPNFATDNRFHSVKFSNPRGSDYIVKTYNDIKPNEYDTRFEIIELSNDESTKLISEWNCEDNLNTEGNVIKNTTFITEKIWNTKTEFEKEFTIDELTKFYNSEYFINKIEGISEDDKIKLVMTTNTMFRIYERINVFYNTDKMLQEMMKFLIEIGFVTKNKVNNIIGFSL